MTDKLDYSEVVEDDVKFLIVNKYHINPVDFSWLVCKWRADGKSVEEARKIALEFFNDSVI